MVLRKAIFNCWIEIGNGKADVGCVTNRGIQVVVEQICGWRARSK